MAPSASVSLPGFLSDLPNDADQVQSVLAIRHPEYTARLTPWTVLLDAFEGAGGFLDGSYLWPYPSESAEDFAKRKSMARFHNYISPLVELYTRYLWTDGVDRQSNSEEYNAWTRDVDGAGTSLDDLMKRLVSVALVHGHAGVLVDKTAAEPSGPTKADEQSRVIASVFTALAIADWRFDTDGLAAVKLLEAPPAVSILADTPTGDEAVQYLIWDREGYARFNHEGTRVGADTPNLGLVPLVILRPQPSYASAMTGRPLMGDAKVHLALFNRPSEEDEVLRTQAFSLLTVSVAADGNVQEAKTDIGTAIGTSKAIVVKGDIAYQTPDQNVPGTIRANIEYLVQEVYRAAHVPYSVNSLQRDSGESRRMQYTELNEMLQGIGKALAAAERQIARCWFAWMFPTADAAEAAFEAAEVEATYPDEFFRDDLMGDLEAWAEALRMGLGPTMEKRLKRKAVRRLDPEIPEAELLEIDAEIDELPDDAPVVMVPDTGDPVADGIAAGAPRV